MNSLTVELEIPGAIAIKVTDESLTAELADGRTITAPLGWYPPPGPRNAGRTGQLGAERRGPAYTLGPTWTKISAWKC